MSMNYGNNVVSNARTGIAAVGPGGWVRLVSSGSTPLSKRWWIKIQAKGRNALAIAYTRIGSDNTFPTPTGSAHAYPMYPGNSIIGEPIGENVMVWGKSQAKADSSDGGLRVSVTEFA